MTHQERKPDITPLGVGQNQPETLRSKLTWNGALQTAREHWINQPHTPENVTRVFETIWASRASTLQEAGLDIDLTFVPCAYTKEELAKLESEGRRVGYLPPELATQDQRHLLGIIFPDMKSNSIAEGNGVANESDRAGWFDYEEVIEAPHLDLTEASLRTAVDEIGKRGMNLNEYIVASQDSHFFTGLYFGQKQTLARLLSSNYDGITVFAEFDRHGSLFLHMTFDPHYHFPGLGGRSVGIPQAK